MSYQRYSLIDHFSSDEALVENGPPVLRKPRIGSLIGDEFALPEAVDGEDDVLLLLSKFFAKADTDPRLNDKSLLSALLTAAAEAGEDWNVDDVDGGDGYERDGFCIDEFRTRACPGPGTGTGGTLLFRLIASCRSFIRSLQSRVSIDHPSQQKLQKTLLDGQGGGIGRGGRHRGRGVYNLSSGGLNRRSLNRERDFSRFNWLDFIWMFSISFLHGDRGDCGDRVLVA